MINIFRITVDDYILYDYRFDEYKIYNPKLSLEANKTGSFSFKIYSNHANFDKIKKLGSIVKVYQNELLIFRGRVLEDTTDVYKAKDVLCEGELAFLLDSVYRPFNLTGQTISIGQFFTMLINNHNSQVKDFQKFILGEITVEDENEKINFSSETALKTLDVITSRLIENYEGYLFITYDENEMPIINYLKEPPYTAIQKIEFGKNMIDINNLISGANISTAVIPYGAKLSESENTKRLTIESVNDGKDYLVNEEMAEIYGLIFANPEETTWDDVTVASNLKTKGTEFLANAIKLNSTIELKSIDLSNVYDIQAFHFLDHIRILSTYHSIDEIYLLEKLELDLFNPQNTTITLGVTLQTITDASNNVGKVITRIDYIEKEYAKNDAVVNLVNTTLEESTAIEQRATAVVVSALQEYVKTTDYNTYKETNSSELQVLAEQIIANFTTTTSSIENVDGDLKQKYEELKSYIRGYQNDDGQPVVELGDNQSNIKLKLENDEIYFEVNGVKSFYLTAEGKIVFKNAVFEETTEIGNGFGFVPRSNGNISFKKVRR